MAQFKILDEIGAIHTEADSDSAVLAQLKKDEIVTVVEDAAPFSKWTRVALSDGRTGYISQTVLYEIQTTSGENARSCVALIIQCLMTVVVSYYFGTWLSDVLPPGRYPAIVFAFPVVVVVVFTFFAVTKIGTFIGKLFKR